MWWLSLLCLAPPAAGQTPYDADGDGWPAGMDCDDRDWNVYPGAPDACGDGVDADCDGVGEPQTDEDGDGLTTQEEVPLGLDPCEPDSDGGGVDDGEELARGTDPLDPADDQTDTATTPPVTDTGTTPPVTDTGSPTTTPPTTATADTGPPAVVDADGDGVPADEDCDDADADVYPGAPEDPGGVDRDCDGLRDPPVPVQLACGCRPATPSLLPGPWAVLWRRR